MKTSNLCSEIFPENEMETENRDMHNESDEQ